MLPILGGVVYYDRTKLKAAILARRDESRRMNKDLHDSDKDEYGQPISSGLPELLEFRR
jgi:hypothetical protein